jgi:anti-sigma factor RsiW
VKSAINIANYEEFFLLYVDGELSAADQQMVERFVQENPHLTEELDMLMQMKLPVEEMKFADKEVLFRNGSAEISQENYETHFLLYVDNELDAARKTNVETFVLQHPSLQEEFMLLNKTKLEPETIVFPDKASLYRKEEKERRVIYMRWQRIAVAAALIGVIALVWTLVPSNNTTAPEITSTASGTGGITTPSQAAGRESGTAVNPVSAPTAGIIETVREKNNDIQPVAVQPVQKQAENLVAVNTPENNTANETTRKDEVTRFDPPQTIVTTNPVGNTGGMENRPVEINTVPGNGIIADKKHLVNTINDPSENTTAVAQPAVYKELDTDTEDNKKSLYVGSIEINKDKLRGLFRKASSLFRGKAKQQEEERSENAPSSSNTRSLR